MFRIEELQRGLASQIEKLSARERTASGRGTLLESRACMRRIAGTVALVVACGGDPDAGSSADGTSGTGSAVTSEASASGTSTGASTDGGSTDGSETTAGGETASSTSNEGTSGATTSSTGDVESGSDDGSSSSGGELGDGLYVHAESGLNSNAGTADAPLRTIQWALQLAIEGGVPNIFVAAGEYTASTDDEQAIDVPGGISLHGGFAVDDWDVRDPDAHPTRIVGTGDYVVRITGGERDDTRLDGFVIEANGSAGPVVLVDGSPTIRRNHIIKEMSIQSLGRGIEVVDGSPRISRNRILVLEGNDISYVGATGIRVLAGGALIDANMIYAEGEGTFADTHGTAIDVYDLAEVQLHGNSLRAWGVPGRAVAGALANTEIVGNNLIVPTVELFRGCIDSPTSPPAVLTHNNFDCAGFYTVTGEQPIDTLADLHAALPGASDNIEVHLQYVAPTDGDLHIVGVGELVCEFAVGGTDLGGVVDRDYDGESRTEPWTIGAEEHDTPCK